MLIQVLGTQCAACQTLFKNVQKAVQESGVEALVERVEDIGQIIAFDILMTPGLAIDGEVKSAGRVPSVEELKRLILAAGGD